MSIDWTSFATQALSVPMIPPTLSPEMAVYITPIMLLISLQSTPRCAIFHPSPTVSTLRRRPRNSSLTDLGTGRVTSKLPRRKYFLFVGVNFLRVIALTCREIERVDDESWFMKEFMLRGKSNAGDVCRSGWQAWPPLPPICNVFIQAVAQMFGSFEDCIRHL